MAGQVAGQHVRHIGENLAESEIALQAGTCLMPAELGLLASLGITHVTVQRPLRVAYFSTGDELCHPDQPLAWGQIYDSNRYTLYGMLQRLGVVPIDLGIVPDNIAALENAFQVASEQADVIISSGGVSVGESDFTKQIIERLGKIYFWKVAMKPGKPLTFGSLNNRLFFGLPGNPVATMVSFYQFVQPALLKMMHRPYTPFLLNATATHAIKKSSRRAEFLRGILTSTAQGVWTVRACGQQGSAILRSMSEANCFIVISDDQKTIEEGASVLVQPFFGMI
jgi:molybdopterin molybdotransferase